MRWAAGTALLAAILMGCGDGNDGESAADPSSSPTPSATPPASTSSPSETATSFPDTRSLIAAAEAAGVSCRDPLLLADDALAACKDGTQMQGGLDAKEKANFVDLFATGGGLDMGAGSVLVGEDWAVTGLPRLMTLLQAELGGTIL